MKCALAHPDKSLRSLLFVVALSCTALLSVVPTGAQSVTIVKNRNTAISKQAQNLAMIPVQHQQLLSSAQERILYLNAVMQGPPGSGRSPPRRRRRSRPMRLRPALSRWSCPRTGARSPMS